MEIRENRFSLEEITASSIVASLNGEVQEDGLGLHHAGMRLRRLELGLKQGDIALMVGFKTEASICHFEMLRAFPPPEVAQKIADILETSSEELFPEWLKFHIRPRKKNVLREIPEADLDPSELNRAIETEDRLTAVDPHSLAEKTDLKDQVREVLDDRLTETERLLINFRFGIGIDQGHTLEEVAQAFKLSVDDLKIIQNRVFRKLRCSPKIARRLMELLD